MLHPCWYLQHGALARQFGVVRINATATSTGHTSATYEWSTTGYSLGRRHGSSRKPDVEFDLVDRSEDSVRNRTLEAFLGESV